ncbi:MAG: hypothetical protein KME04_01315 [Pleurocapsa minor GSE-CHR-MK-17-07R]|jgi:hypothetical protein|nr:hypothetical protein [Pleurocapsa minor GSE-CHR-MK 17-07R]
MDEGQQLSDFERFRRWYVEPLSKLDNDGSFVNLIVALTLYERYLQIKVFRITKMRKPKPGKEWNIWRDHFDEHMASDLEITTDFAKTFWTFIRNGLMHEGMPQKTGGKNNVSAQGYFFDSSFDHRPFEGRDIVTEEKLICLNPSAFAEYVIGKYMSDPTLISESGFHPIAPITRKLSNVKRV